MSDNLEHSDWEDQLQDWVDGDLDIAQSAALEEHLSGCSACRARMKALQAVDGLLCRSLPPEALDASFDCRVLERVAKIEMANWAATRERLERERQAQIAALAWQWRRAWRALALNIVAAGAVLIALAAGFGGILDFVSSLQDQTTLLLRNAILHPTIALLVASGLSVVSLWVVRVFLGSVSVPGR